MFLEESKKSKFVLASSSPRRKSILGMLNIDFISIPPHGIIEERFKTPVDTVIKNSIKKSKNVFDYVKINEDVIPDKKDYFDSVICGFDTIVYFKKKYYFKPLDINEAEKFLKDFSGNIHSVFTGFCILSLATGKITTGFEKTNVSFRKLTERDIKEYITNEFVLDKAGAYNIEGFGSFLVKRIEGCFYNVAGLPVYSFFGALKKAGYGFYDFK